MKTLKFFVVLTLLSASPAFAQMVIDDFDFFLSREDVGNGVVVGTINDVVPETTFTPGARVVGAEFSALGLSEEPGFFNPGTTGGLSQGPNGTAPLPGDQITLARVDVEIDGNTGSDLLFWDGVGPVSFAPATGGATISFGALEGEGGGVLEAEADGAFDGHPDYLLQNFDEGVYLIAVTAQLGSVANGFTDPSDPLFIAYATSTISEASLDAAVDFVSAALVPEPASLSLLAVGAFGLLGRRRN